MVILRKFEEENVVANSIFDYLTDGYLYKM